MLARRQDAAAPVVPATTGRRPVVGTVDHRGRVAGMRGKAVLVTGASSGIGLAASRHLAGLGAELVMVSRDPIRGAAARDEVAKVALGPQPVFLAADLSSQQAIRLLAQQLHARYGRLDVLINNAGTARRRRELTVDGIERTLATNHLAAFLLTRLLLDLLLAAPAGRVVTVTSEAHSGRLDFDNLQGDAATTSSAPTTAPSWPTSCSPTSWLTGCKPPRSPPTVSLLARPRPTSAAARAASWEWCPGWCTSWR